MIIRKTKIDDLKEIDLIYQAAKSFMRQHGNTQQWSGEYPNSYDSKIDITNDCSYVVIDDNNKIVATFAFILAVDKTYNYIENGKWLNDEDYGVIHRIAASQSGLNILKLVTEYCLNHTSNIRIDTHQDNYVMQNALKKLNYTYCGIIYLENGDKRLAYQLNKDSYLW